MKAGDLRHRVTFERAVDTADADTNEQVRSWDTASACTVYAAVEPIRGQEGEVAGGVESSQDVRIRVRWSPQMAAFTAKDRALWNGKYFNVVESRDVDTRGREILFFAREGLNDAR